MNSVGKSLILICRIMLWHWHSSYYLYTLFWNSKLCPKFHEIEWWASPNSEFSKLILPNYKLLKLIYQNHPTFSKFQSSPNSNNLKLISPQSPTFQDSKTHLTQLQLFQTHLTKFTQLFKIPKLTSPNYNFQNSLHQIQLFKIPKFTSPNSNVPKLILPGSVVHPTFQNSKAHFNSNIHVTQLKYWLSGQTLGFQNSVLPSCS